MHQEAHILIVDDELIIAEHLKRTLKKLEFPNTLIAKNYTEAVHLIGQKKPQIVLLDISLGEEKTGIDLGRWLNREIKIPFIYITSLHSADVVREAYDTRPNAYLVKPFKAEDLKVAVEMALFQFTETTSTFKQAGNLTIKDGSVDVSIPFDEITVIKAEENYTCINTINEGSKLIRQYISDVQKLLPDNIFIRIHRSYIVNKKFVSKAGVNTLMICNFQIPVGRSYRPALRDFEV